MKGTLTGCNDAALERNAMKGALNGYNEYVALEPVGRPTVPLVEHLAMIGNRLDQVEGDLQVIRNWIVGPSPDCDTCESSEPNLESQVLRTERTVARIEEIVKYIRNRLS